MVHGALEGEAGAREADRRSLLEASFPLAWRACAGTLKHFQLALL